MIFKSICLAVALLAAPTNAVVSSSNSTKLSDDTDEPKRRLGAADGAYQRRDRDLGEDTTSAFVLLKRDGAEGYGHVAGCFEKKDEGFVCFSTDNPDGEFSTSRGWDEKGFWYKTVANQDEVLDLFKGKAYTDWKRLDVTGADFDQATSRMETVAGMGYNLVNRNCQNDVYDVLHDEGSGYGITANYRSRNNGCYIGWVQSGHLGPSRWFDVKIAATASGLWKSDKNGRCWGDKYCASGLSCCGGKCKALVNKRRCISQWWSWSCWDNWKCP